MKKICLVSVLASHYRKRIYQIIEEQYDCDFVFGIDRETVKTMDTSCLKHVVFHKNVYLGGTNYFYQESLIKATRGYNIVINDLGPNCLSSWLLLLLSKIRRQKVYNWAHGWYGRESGIKILLKRIYFGLAEGSFIYGEYAIKLMAEHGINSAKLHAIHNSLDYERHVVIRNHISPSDIYKEHFKNSAPVIVMIGRLNYRKNLDQLLLAMKILRDRGESYNVVLIGDGEYKESLEKMAKELDLEKHVWFYGACYDEKTNAELIYNSDLCVVPGDIGLTAIHSMTFGVPVITHNSFPHHGPEFGTIKEGKTGAFFQHNSPTSLADVIQTWFKSHMEDREEIRQNCYDEIDGNWTPDYQIGVIKDVLDEKESK